MSVAKKAENTFLVFRLVIVVTTSSAFGTLTIALVVATMCRMWGPGLVLRGRGTESAHFALRRLEMAFDTCYRFFIFGLALFCAACVVAPFGVTHFVHATAAAAVLSVGAMLILADAVDTTKHLTPRKMTSGHLHGDPFRISRRCPKPCRVASHDAEVVDFQLVQPRDNSDSRARDNSDPRARDNSDPRERPPVPYPGGANRTVWPDNLKG